MIHANLVVILGTVGHIESKTFDGDRRLLRLRVVTRQRFRKGDQEYERHEWHTVALWGNLASALEPIVTKGAPIFVLGTLRYTKAEGSGQVYTTIVARSVSVLSRKSDTPAPLEQAETAHVPLEEDMSPDEDLPF